MTSILPVILPNSEKMHFLWKPLMTKFISLNMQWLLSDGEVIFLCFNKTCFCDAESQENGEQNMVTHI